MGINLLPSLSILKSSTRAALFGTTALVASASGAQAVDYIVNTAETSTFILGLGTADTLTINGSGEITTVSPGVAVIDLADSITIESTGVTAEIDADAVGIEVQGVGADLTGGISIASGAIVTATNTGSTAGTGILVHTGADISGGVNNSGAITGYDYGILVDSSASISGGLTNSGTVFGEQTAVLISNGATSSQTLGGIVNTGTIGINAAGTDTADYAIKVSGINSDISGLIDNDGIINANTTAIVVSSGDISGGIDNSGVIGANGTTAAATATADYGIYVSNSGDISGGIVNSGTIVGDTNAIDVATGSISGGITNSGNILGGAADAAIAISAGTIGSTASVGIANQTAGVISGNSAIKITSGSIVYGITNSGAIFGTGGTKTAISANSSQFNGGITNNSGGIIGANALGAVATSDAIGIGFVNTDSTDGITNTGVITGTDQGIALLSSSDLTGAITNNALGIIGTYAGITSGTVSATTGILIDGSSSVAGGVINSGSIVGTATGISLSGAGSSVGTAATTSSMAVMGILNNAGGVIAGGSTGVSVDGATVLGGISNSGDIVGNTIGIYLDNTATVASINNGLTTGRIAGDTTAIRIAGGSTITGVLSNAGVIGIDADATGPTVGTGTAARGLFVTGSASDITGGVNNSGTIKGTNAAIEVQSSAAISGGITNSSLIGDLTNSTDGIHVNGGTVGSTSGTGISNTSTGVIAGSNAGILVTGSGEVRGGISNASSAAINGGAIGINVSSASVTGGVDNDGLLSGGTTGLNVSGTTSTISGVVDNSGTISGSAAAINVSGTSAALLGGIVNSGTIYGTASAIIVAGGGDIAGITNSGLLGATTGGAYANTAAILVTGSSSDISGAITNTGTIRSDANAISLIASGSITGGIANNSGGTIQGDGGDGISIAVGSVVGSTAGTGISNGGTIRGTANAIDIDGSVLGGIGNTGTILSTGGEAIAVSGVSASVTGGIVNGASSVISATSSAAGILIESGASVTGGISNSGYIYGDNDRGIHVDSASLAGNITNAASATISGGSTGIRLNASTLTGSIVNTGAIDGSNGAGISLANTATITGTITNNSGGIIEGPNYGILIESGSSVTGGISNAVSATIRGSSSSATGILVSNTSTVSSITNSGTIEGGSSTGYGIFASTGSTVSAVTNAGTIEGADGSVQFGTADSTLTLQTGSNLIGEADGGTGTNDTLVLTGAGSENEVFTDFEHLTVSASASGTWALSGNSNFDDLTVNTGTLDIQGTVNATTATVAGGTLSVSSTGVLSVDSVAATSGDLDVVGALTATSTVTVGGTLNVSNTGTLTAATVVASGDADVEGLIVATTMTVAGTLSGSGTISGGLTVSGILSPGNSPGQLNVVGSFAEANSSSYLVEHLPGATPETDIVVVTGTATIGTDVDVNVSVGAGTDGFEDDILTATGGITGTYDDVTGLDDNVVGLIAYPDANTATLLVAKTDALVATVGTVSDAGFIFLDNLQEGARRDGRVWASAYIYNAENEGLGTNGADYDQDAFGFNAGVDVISEPDLKVGVALGYIDGDVDIDSSTSEAENDGIFGAAYLNYMNDNFYLDGAVMVGQQSVDTTRTLTAGTATASTDATSYGANLEAGLELEALGGRLSPFVKVGIHSASLDGYSEAGAAGAMTVASVDTQQMRVGGGFRYAVDLGSEDGIQVTPAIKVGMTQEWQDTDSSADIGFVGYTGSTTASLDFEDQTTIDLGLSFDVKLSEAVSAFVGWDAALGDETSRNTGTIGLSVNW